MLESVEKRSGLLIVVSGPAGVGKGTIDARLLSRHPNMVLSVSATTRKPRPGEIDGVHYSFISEAEFCKRIKEDAFLEYMRVFDTDYYGTPKEPVLRHLFEGRDVLLEIDVQGAMRVREKFPEAVLIFVAPPDMNTLKKRLIGRHTESIESIERRFAAAYAELKYIDRYDYIVLNEDIDIAVIRMESIVCSEKCRILRNRYLVERLTKGVI